MKEVQDPKHELAQMGKQGIHVSLSEEETWGRHYSLAFFGV